MITYVPRGSAKPLLAWLEAHPEQKTIYGKQCSEIMGVGLNAVSHCLAAAIKHGALHVTKEGMRNVYSLHPFEEVEPDREAFNPCLWGDGDLVLRGVIQLEDGSVQINAVDVPMLKRLLNGNVVA